MLTGAGGAIASVMVSVLRDEGARLVLVERDGHHLEARADEEVVAADLTNPRDAAELARYPVDALVHTVGGFAMQRGPEATPEDLELMFRLNFDSLFHTVRAVLPGMLDRGYGRVVGIGAGQAARGAGPGAALYTASKAAVASYLKSLDAELKEGGVRTTVLYPMGGVDTPRNRDDGMKSENMIDPVDLAQGVVYVLTRSQRGHVDELRVNPR